MHPSPQDLHEQGTGMLGGVRARREQGWTLGSWRGTVVSPSRGLGLPEGPQGLSRVEGEGQRWDSR